MTDQPQGEYRPYEGAADPFMKAKFYACHDGEELTDTDPDEAIEAWLDRFLSPKCDVLATLKEEVGETVTVRAYVPMALSENEPDPARVLELVLEELDEKYANPESGPEQSTEEMRAAATAFCSAIRAAYVPWACEEVGKVVVNVERWVRAERPDWLVPA